MTATTTAQMLKMSDADYFAHDALNHSSLRWLMPPSTPQHFRWRMDNPQHEPTSDMIFGTAVHSLVLGGVEVVPIDADNWRTKAAQQERDDVLARGRLPLLAGDYDRAIACRDAVLKHPIAGKLVATLDHAEVTILWDEEAGDGRQAQLTHYARVACKGKLDGISGRFKWDLKTTYNADVEAFGRSAAKYDYHTGAAFYRRAAKAVGIEDGPFLFVVVEKEPPHLVNVIQLDDYTLELADRAIDRALDTYRRCTESGEWPGYELTIQTAQLPRYAEIAMETE